MTIEDDLAHLCKLRAVGEKLIRIVETLAEGGFKPAMRAKPYPIVWVYGPKKFVGFEILYKRTDRINLSFLGGPTQFNDVGHLLHWNGGWYNYRIRKPQQFAMAKTCIRKAFENWESTSHRLM